MLSTYWGPRRAGQSIDNAIISAIGGLVARLRSDIALHMPGNWLIHLGQGASAHCAAALAALIAGVLLSACSTNVGDAQTPSTEVPSAHIPYPGVHDMPPPRSNTTLNATEQVQAEKDLINVRDAVTNRAQKKPSNPQPGAGDASNKKPVKSDPPTTQATGGDRNP